MDYYNQFTTKEEWDATFKDFEDLLKMVLVYLREQDGLDMLSFGV